MHTRESISKELKRIQDSVPKLLRDFTLTEIPKTPAIEMVFKKALENKDLPEEKRKQIENILTSGRLSKKIIVENEKIAKMRDEYVTREMKRSVREGRLPTKKQLKELKLLELHDNKKGVPTE